jgi:Tol biopolymer transport system component
VLELATGQSKQVTDESPIRPYGLQFTPDGSSILFTGGPEARAESRIVPVSGGKSTLLFDPQARGFGYTGEGSLSPDGSLVTFMGHRIGGPGALRFVADADGTDWRSIGSCISNPAGTWSPDGSRIVCGPNGPPPGIRVKNIATGHTTFVAKGRVAIWLDDHTLLVDV